MSVKILSIVVVSKEIKLLCYQLCCLRDIYCTRKDVPKPAFTNKTGIQCQTGNHYQNWHSVLKVGSLPDLFDHLAPTFAMLSLTTNSWSSHSSLLM